MLFQWRSCWSHVLAALVTGDGAAGRVQSVACRCCAVSVEILLVSCAYDRVTGDGAAGRVQSVASEPWPAVRIPSLFLFLYFCLSSTLCSIRLLSGLPQTRLASHFFDFSLTRSDGSEEPAMLRARSSCVQFNSPFLQLKPRILYGTLCNGCICPRSGHFDMNLQGILEGIVSWAKRLLWDN